MSKQKTENLMVLCEILLDTVGFITKQKLIVSPAYLENKMEIINAAFESVEVS